MTKADIVALRLVAQHLTEPGAKDVDSLLYSMVAMQAQDYAAAKWSIGLRVANVTDMQLDSLFNKGSFLRTHAMRPTWHFLSPRDIRWLQDATAHRVCATLASSGRKLGLDEAIYKKSNKLISKALGKGRNLCRSEIADILDKNSLPTGDLQMIHIMMRAELDGLICSGPRIGKQFTYALMDDLAFAKQKMTRDEMLAMLAERYFTSRGPATLQDFMWWSGLTQKEASAGLYFAAGRLQKAVVDGVDHWYSTGITDDKVTATFLMPNYDEYTVAYKNRDIFYDERKIKRRLTSFGILGNNIIVDGLIAGVWKRSFVKREVQIELEYYYALPKLKRQAVEHAAHRYAQFHGLPLSIVYK